jgi:lipopolysaccharide transport system ATP-binding protein
VLAVGDAQFQKKCLGKMRDISRLGRTVLFVSHNMKAIRQLCSRAILLRGGVSVAEGPSVDITEKYLQEDAPSPSKISSIQQVIATAPSDDAIQWLDIRLSQDGAPVVHTIANGRPLDIAIRYRVRQRTTGLRIFCDVVDTEETLLFRSFHDETAEGIPVMEPGNYLSTAIIPADILAPVDYELVIRAGIHNVRPCQPINGISISVSVEATGRYNRAYLGDTQRGKLAISLSWETRRIDDAAA